MLGFVAVLQADGSMCPDVDGSSGVIFEVPAHLGLPPHCKPGQKEARGPITHLNAPKPRTKRKWNKKGGSLQNEPREEEQLRAGFLASKS